MDDFFLYFLQCVGIMIDLIVLLYPTYSEIVSRVRIKIHGPLLFVFIYYFDALISFVYMLLNPYRMQQ